MTNTPEPIIIVVSGGTVESVDGNEQPVHIWDFDTEGDGDLDNINTHTSPQGYEYLLTVHESNVRTDLEISRALICSTAHITASDDDLFDKASQFIIPSSPILCDSFPYGYWIYVNPSPTAFYFHQLVAFGYSLALVALLKLAHDNNCLWIKLDRDGDIIPGLETFEW